MNGIFSAREIVDIGIQIEKNGIEFYTEAAKNAKSEKTRAIFEKLGYEEEKHIKMFENILLKTAGPAPVTSLTDGYYAYFNTLAKEHIFSRGKNGKEYAQRVNSDIEALDLAIRFEKDSILLYEEARKNMPESAHSAVNMLIVQEREHYVVLSQIKENLEAKKK